MSLSHTLQWSRGAASSPWYRAFMRPNAQLSLQL